MQHWLITATLLWEGWEEYVVECNGKGRSGLAWFRIEIRELKGMKGEIESRTCSSSRRIEAPRNTKIVGEFFGQQFVKREWNDNFQETCEVLQNYRSEAVGHILI